MYIAPGRDTRSLGDKILMSTEIPYHFAHLLLALKKSLWSLIFYHFLCVFSHVYSPRQGQTTHWGQKFYDTRKAFSLCPNVVSFKMISLKIWFYTYFNDFIHVYSPGTRAENPLGTIFDVNRKPLSLWPFVASFKQKSLNCDFIHIF